MSGAAARTGILINNKKKDYNKKGFEELPKK